MSRFDTIGKHATNVFSEEGSVNVVYHNTVVVRFNSSGVRLNSGGFLTNTTKTRMNQAANQFGLGFHVYQKNWDWFVSLENGSVIPFEDNMLISRNQEPVQEPEPIR